MTHILADPADITPFITPEGARRRVLSYGGGMMAVQFEFDADVAAPIHSHAVRSN